MTAAGGNRGVHALMLIATVLIAAAFPLGEWIARDLDPAVLTLLRFGLAALLFAPVIALRYGLRVPRWADLAVYSLLSLTLVGFFWCMFEALRHTSALNTSAIFVLVPGLAALYARWLLAERTGGTRTVALLIGLAGALWVVFEGRVERLLAFEVNRGDAVFFAGCLLMALYTPLLQRSGQRAPMAVVTFWVLLTGALWLLAVTAPRLGSVDWGALPPRLWGGVAYLALFGTLVTFYLLNYATPRIGSTQVVAYGYGYPALVVLMDWATGRGLPPPGVLPGVLLVLAAIVVIQRHATR